MTLLERPAAGEADPELEAGLEGGGHGPPDIGGDGPPEDGPADDDEATFAGFVADYALRPRAWRLGGGRFTAALDDGGWERAPG